MIKTFKSILALILMAVFFVNAVSTAVAAASTARAASSAGGQEPDPEQALTYAATIGVGGVNQYKAVKLTPQVYNASNRDLSDILVKESGENIPYFINSGLQNVSQTTESYQMELIDSFVKDNSFFFDYKLAEERAGDTVATSIEITTSDSSFAKPVNVYGSHDGINWKFVKNDILYKVDSSTKLSVDFAQPQKYTYYRFNLANNLEMISFSGVKLVYSVAIYEETYFIESFMPEFSVSSENKKTEIAIKGLRNLRLCDITVYSDSMFKRVFSARGGIRKELYKLSLNGVPYSDAVIPLNRQISDEETYTITIDDGDDKPIDITGLAVRYYADEVVFAGTTGKAYTLEFGRDPAKKAPVYDIDRYKNEIIKGEIDKAVIGDISSISVAAAPEEAPAFDYRLIFNIVIIAVALLLGFVIVLRLWQKR
jgi:hypothetical protein